MLGWYHCGYWNHLQGKGMCKKHCYVLFPSENGEMKQTCSRCSHWPACSPSSSYIHSWGSGYIRMLFRRWVSSDWFIGGFFSKLILIFSNIKQSNHKQEWLCDDSYEFLAISSITVRKWEIYPNIISFYRFIITRSYFIAILWRLYLDTCAHRKPPHFWQFPFFTTL